MSPAARLEAQFAFLLEADRLKQVLRGTTLADGSRRENSGEHSWHLALYAMVLADHAPQGVDIGRVLRMMILHDLVEIDAGDHPIHGSHDPVAQAAAEAAAADRIFGMLPPDLATEFRTLWQEFEAAETADAVFAKAIDRVQPVMQNVACGGGTWAEYQVTADQLETRVGRKVAQGAPQIWAFVREKTRAYFG
ncbi:hydrolase [Rhodobacter veldkampii DSM 11550]|uniref:Hydrolase n=1 Tax=Phaeovulum veldkampii DSM 11550 TaxID=1185920 RepID=A0A2T4JGG0_9RHOB|nr:HD domain-containing protein [Phaeovulum veldkampii]MBK5946280.1 hydrolase [Phaeovulum veldkampii DSM 11550]PTE16933.1 hydrolase [Phaeovulum veldkampii DSM 11550]TDQ56461.1 putative hydrolase of HD superfamily [Phaeovulum veldkampii DSM 11550]